MATLIGDGSHAYDIASVTPHTHVCRSDTDWQTSGDKFYLVTIGINDPRLRAEVAERMGVDDLPWVHPNALLGHATSYGVGTHINYGVTMTRTTIGHHCTISPGVTICGDVTIGDRTLIGAGATICDRVTIGSDVTVGAGAVVLPETVIPDGETWIGVPARVRP
jgi:carbonic anhydrase/acetyltransferase-like protein (isoleucine patch superfamily)